MAEPITISRPQIDPKWRAGVVTIDGAPHVFLRITSLLGDQDYLLPMTEARNLAATLVSSADQVEAARGATPSA